jgi:hypothetical protein
LLVLSILSITGCRRHQQGPTAEIRFVDAVPDADAIRLTVTNKQVIPDVASGDTTPFTAIPVGTYTVDAKTRNNGSWTSGIAPLRCTLEQNHHYTAVAMGSIKTSPQVRIKILDDDEPSEVAQGEAEIDIVDAYPHWGKLDVTINNIVAFAGLEFGKRSKLMSLPAKEYVCKAMRSGQFDSPVAGPAPLDLKSGQTYLLLILDQKSDNSSGILVLPND